MSGKHYRQQRRKHNLRQKSPGKAQPQETHFTSCFGETIVERFPKDYDPTLRAWSAADELLLEHLANDYLSKYKEPRIVLLNDTYGALAINLAKYAPISLCDSLIGREALRHNIELNIELNEARMPAHNISTRSILDSPPSNIDILLMQLPKNFHYLKFQLNKLKPALNPNAIVLAGVMVKHFHQNVLNHFESIIGKTHTTLARKKARLIVARNTQTNHLQPQQSLAEFANQYPLPDTAINLYTLPNVFSMDKADIGTRALLPYISSAATYNTILDLGCGNGALGIKAALENPQARIYFCDDSELAIASAKLSWEHSGLTNQVDFLLSDALSNAPKDLDLILCNPPFHQNNSIHTEIAERMFEQASQHLNSKGQLLVVANSHLPYDKALKKYFTDVKPMAATNKFNIYQASL